MLTRRRFLQASIAAAIAGGAPWYNLIRRAHANPLILGLSDPANQPLFTELAPNAMAAAFKYVPKNNKLRSVRVCTGWPEGMIGCCVRHSANIREW